MLSRTFLRDVMLFAASLSTVSGSPGAEPEVAPYGSWRSPITPQMLVEKQVQFGDISLDGQNLYWVEMRPEEAGRYVIVHQEVGGAVHDILPAPYSARTLVHEYGGGALLAAGGTIYFTNFEDQQLWKTPPRGEPERLTSAEGVRLADCKHDALRDRLIGVAEDHSVGGEPVARIVQVALGDGRITSLAEGEDFYSSPRLSPDGRQLAWLSWNHPDMPWDGTRLWVADIDDDGGLGAARHVAGSRTESIFQPLWSPDGKLYFVSDRSGWWNLYREQEGGIEPVLTMEAEFGLPQWVFGLSTYGFDRRGDIIGIWTQGGMWHLGRIEPRSGQLQESSLPYSYIRGVHVADGRAWCVVSSPTEAAQVVEIDTNDGSVRVIRRSSPVKPDLAYTSIPEPIEFPTENDATAHAFYYPPTNRDYQGPPGELPPLLVIIHGGPTSATRAEFRLSVQFWTSRGFGVCDVNYGGSTGYGREYRNRLRDSWGMVDVADASNAALYLADQGRVDRERLLIRGGSAGGYTTLASLAFGDVFCGGASYYGVSDLALLARETHKFESRYLDQLVGPYPEQEDRYRDRSPIHHLEAFDRPVLLLQGLEDKVVPPNQAEAIFGELDAKGIPVAYVAFPGEQHGFRQAKNIIRAHEAELYFYSRILGFPLPQPIEPVAIRNLP